MHEKLAIDQKLQDFLQALASPTRQKILFCFFEQQEITVGEIAKKTGLAQSTASEQLSILARGGLIEATKNGKFVSYRINVANIKDSVGSLSCCLEACGCSQTCKQEMKKA